MHSIEIGKRMNTINERMYVAAIAEVMGINLPNNIKVVSNGSERRYSIKAFNLLGVCLKNKKNRSKS